MPYNNAAIPPPEEITGTTTLPLTRVKRMLQLDEDINSCSANAAFAITIATEMFIRYLAEQALVVVKSEKKPRRNIQYKDLASAVARIDNLEFLSDVIPRTTTFREYKEKKARAGRTDELLPNGQRTLDNLRSLPQRPAQVAHSSVNDDDSSSDQETIDDLPEEARLQSKTTNGADDHEPNDRGAPRDESEDVEMD